MCRCGSLGGLIDPNCNLTRCNYDVGSRLTGKIYPDGTKVSYEYEPLSGRLASITDGRLFLIGTDLPRKRFDQHREAVHLGDIYTVHSLRHRNAPGRGIRPARRGPFEP